MNPYQSPPVEAGPNEAQPITGKQLFCSLWFWVAVVLVGAFGMAKGSPWWAIAGAIVTAAAMNFLSVQFRMCVACFLFGFAFNTIVGEVLLVARLAMMGGTQ